MSKVVTYAKSITIYELTYEELSKLLAAVQKNEMDNDFAKAVEAEHEYRERRARAGATWDFPRDKDGGGPNDFFEWFDCLFCGYCPTCGREADVKIEDYDNGDTDQEAELECPVGHKHYAFRSRYSGDWS